MLLRGRYAQAPTTAHAIEVHSEGTALGMWIDARQLRTVSAVSTTKVRVNDAVLEPRRNGTGAPLEHVIRCCRRGLAPMLY
jgi:hypothetical protein